MRPSDIFSPKTHIPTQDELEDLYLAALLNQKCGVSTCSLPTDLVIWLLQQGIGVSGGLADAQVQRSFESRMDAVFQRIYKPTDQQE